ncbi:type II secretion system protein GspL [Sphingomonas sp.]|uniref:type II secretion system protein GspL n=1 Tax=Sphingomonas sp. TaxID=28214 RepID=UPI002E309E87|nr:type II secretion system protein GspL [Sphingomonas sp.]HEX4693965.1 type II secretion system protein GspL [Sphingomonas sp.]
MSDTLALFLPADSERRWRWLAVRDGAVAMRGDGLPAPVQPAGTRVVAIAPAEAVTLHWADLPDRSQAQAVAAARLLVAEASVTPLGDLHVAVGREEGLAERPIGAVAAVQMDDWLAMLAGAGFEAEAIVPAPMLLPRPDEGYVVGDLGGADGGVVRGRSSGFADEDGLTALVIGDASVLALDRDALEAAIVAALADPALDLRQGLYALRKRAAIDWLLVRRLAWLLAAIMAATLLITLAQIVRYNASAAALEAQADSLARQGLGRGEAVTDARQQLTDRLARLRGGGAGFSQTAASVSAAVAATPGAEISGLSFDPSGKLRVSLAVQAQGQILEVQNRLAAAGFAVDASPFTGTVGRLTGTLTVSPS